MKYKKLRNLFEKHFSSFPDTKKFRNYSVVNEGFPGTFNLSFCEPEVLEHFKNFIDFNHELLYTKIQPCIRVEDFLKVLLPLSKKSSFYLGVFDMAGICICRTSQKKIEKDTRDLIRFSFDFLINKLKLNPNNIFIKCFGGENIKQATDGKYEIDKFVDKDNLCIKEWDSLGLLEENIILDKTRETLLTLFFQKPTPWGYREEILYKLENGEFLDIGTIEYLIYEPIIRNKVITNIKKWENGSCLAVFGLERLSFLINNFNHIKECDHIKPLFEAILNDSKNATEAEVFLFTECIRTSQRIFTDSMGYKNLSRHRKKKLNYYIHPMIDYLGNLKIPKEKLEEYLKINANLQPWYPELKRNVDLVYKELLNTFSRKNSVPSKH